MVTIFTALFLCFSPVLAFNAPSIINPIDESTISTVKLEWAAPVYPVALTNSYQVQIDNSELFNSIDKDYLTKNTSYSPTLGEGLWYWRLRAKDATAIWSDWSTPTSFIYSTLPPSPTTTPVPFQSATPLPTIIHSPTPLPTVSPTQNPTPIPSVISTPSPTPSPVFSVSSTPNSINSEQSFQATIIILLPSQPNTSFYLKGAFAQENSSNYFGHTKYAGNWIKNSQTYSSQFKIQTDSTGRWQGQIEFMPDAEDSGFPDSDDYLFKLARYTSSGSGPTWTDTQYIYISKLIPSPSPFNPAIPSPTTSTSVSLYSPSPKQLLASDEQLLDYESSESGILEASESAFNTDPQIASIEGVATVAGEMETYPPFIGSADGKNPFWFYLAAASLFLTSTIYILIVKYKPSLTYLYENYLSFFRRNS